MAKTPRRPRTAAPDGEVAGVGPEAPVARVAPLPAEVAMLGAQAEMVDLDELYPYERNTRLHSKEQLEALATAMRTYGWTIPLLIREDGGIIAGHARWQVATDYLRLRSGPAIIARGWTEEMIRAYVIWDNKSAEMATWDLPTLHLELGELRDIGFDLTLTGFSLEELKVMDRHANNVRGNPEATPEPPTTPVSRAGDVWLLGEHRLVCGDSTDPVAVAKALNGKKPHLMVTDPPYGVEYDASFRNGIRRENGTVVSARAVGQVMNDDRCDWREAWALFPGAVAYVWHAGIYAPTVAESLVSVGLLLRSQIIWSKSNFAIGRGDYHWQHEPCWYAVRKGSKGHYVGDRKQTTVWEIPKPARSETGHSTQKPVECMARPIRNNSVEGDFVYEPFSGSGTTIIAGQMTGRTVLAIELNPAYVDVGALRWEGFTQGEALLEETRETFAQVKARRAAEALVAAE